jgi:hypothetical protein
MKDVTASATEWYWGKKATTWSRTSSQSHFTNRKMNVRLLHDGYMVALWK